MVTRGGRAGAKVLTDELISEIRVAVENGNRLEVSDGIEPGLRLRLGPRGARWSVLTDGVTGKRSRVDLGSWPTMSVNSGARRSEDRQELQQAAAGLGRASDNDWWSP